MERIIILGGGGHAKSVIDTVLATGTYEIAAGLDPALKKGSKLMNIPVAGADDELARFWRLGIKNCAIGVGSVGDTGVRGRLYLKAKRAGFKFPVLSHPRAFVSEYALLGEGTFVAAQAAVNPGVRTGVCCIVNTGAVVEHDCRLGDFTHVSTNAALCGGVITGAGVHIGAGATVIEGRKIGKAALVGAGSLVARDIGPGWLCYGVPARRQGKK